MIREVIITTRNADGTTHIAPMGVHEESGMHVVAPFRPSRTLDNLLRERCAVMNFTDDVRIYAGALTGRHDWPLVPARRVTALRLAGALAGPADVGPRGHAECPQADRAATDQASLTTWCARPQRRGCPPSTVASTHRVQGCRGMTHSGEVPWPPVSSADRTTASIAGIAGNVALT